MRSFMTKIFLFNLKAFIKDMKVSYELTKELYNQRSTWIKFKEGISQLLSPIL